MNDEIINRIRLGERYLAENFNIRPMYEAADDKFSLEELSAIKSFRGRMNYCKLHLGMRWGSGSSRTVFDIDDERILKLAINSKGIAQNEAEVSASDYTTAVVDVLDYDNDYSWIVEERCIPAKNTDFENVLGYSWAKVTQFIITYYSHYKTIHPWFKRSILDKDTYDKMWKVEWFQELATYLGDFDMPIDDFLRLSSWGMVERDGEPTMVIIDAGLTEDVWDDYYMKSKQKH